MNSLIKSPLFWMAASGLLILMLFAVDLLLVNETTLTPFVEHHQCLPMKTDARGVQYLTDMETGEFYTVKRGKLFLYNPADGSTKDPQRMFRSYQADEHGIVVTYKPISPLYAFYKPALSYKVYFITFLTGLYIYTAFLLKSRLRSSPIKSLLFLAISAVVIRGSFAWLRHGFSQMGGEFLVYANEEFIFDAANIQNLAEFIRSYPVLMPSLSLHGSHFPPGNAVLFKLIAMIAGHTTIEEISSQIWIYGWLIVCLGSTVVIPIYLITKKMANAESAFMAAALFILLPNSISFGAVSMDALFAVTAVWSVYFYVSALTDHSARYSLITGMLLGIASFFSFSAFPLGLFILMMSLLSVIRSKDQFHRQLRICLVIGAGFLGTVILAYLLGYNMYATLGVAMKQNHKLMEEVVNRYYGRELGELWAINSLGNMLSFLIASGVPLAGLWLKTIFALSGNNRDRFSMRDMAIVLALFVIVLACSNLHFRETERIWLYISALIPVAVAQLLNDSQHDKVAMFVVLGCAFQSLASEVLLFTIW